MPRFRFLSARRMTALVLGMLAFLLTTATTADADAGVSRERIRFQSEGEINGFLSDACGITVVEDSRFDIHILEFGDGRSKVHINSWSTLSSPEGELSTIGTSMIQFEPTQVIDSGDGTLTLVIPHRQAVGFVYLINGANVADGGIVHWELRIVVDEVTGDVLNEQEVVVQTTGHFPVFNRDGGAVSLLCDALTA